MVAYPAKEGFLFGCDPELFLQDADGKYVSAEGIIPGTKAEPHKVKGGAVQVDGMAAEFNIDPVNNYNDWNNNIALVMTQLAEMLPKGITLSAVPAVVFDEDIYNKAPSKAKELGCMPDFDAWTGEVNAPPKSLENPFLRTASGHIHIGWTEDADMGDPQHILNCRDLVKQLDWFLGGWSLTKDKDNRRRELYGKAGACRYKDYGVEYRVLSNFWIFELSMRKEVWNRLQSAINSMVNGFLPDRASASINNLLIQSINETKLSSALAPIAKYPIATLDNSYARI